MKRNIFLLLLLMDMVVAQYVTPRYPEIKAVSAMCSSEGITASIDFDRPFNGKIYSLEYATVPDCLYYSNLDQDTVLFSIPAHRCGTRLERSTRNVVDEMENHVYIQMEKELQTTSDKQFSFVCRLSDPGKHIPVPAKDSADFSKDSVKPIASSITTKVPTLMTPIKPITSVQKVSAFSADAHLGNWPIPGAKPYENSMKPISSYPVPPLDVITTTVVATTTPMTTTTTTTPQPAIRPYTQIAHAPPETYVTEHRSLSPAGLPSAILNPPLFPVASVHHSPPILPNLLPVFPSITLPPPTAQTFPPPTSMKTPILPAIHVNNGVGVPLAPVHVNPNSQIDAHKWSEAYVTPPSSPFEGVTVRDEKATLREEPPTVDTRFSTDSSEVTRKNSEILSSTQNYDGKDPEVTLEIQQGEGPYSPPIDRPIKIGDNITLVVKARSFLKDPTEFDMFVHSCFATDGKGTTKIQMVDDKGCVLRREFASSLNRTKDPAQNMYYFLQIKAFKFPGPDDVYFSCTIDFTPLRIAPQICHKTSTWRSKRATDWSKQVRLFDTVSVELPTTPEYENSPLSATSPSSCWDDSAVFATVSTLMVSLIASLTFSLFLLQRQCRAK